MGVGSLFVVRLWPPRAEIVPDGAENRWVARPVLRFVVRMLMGVAPFGASVAAGVLVARALPPGDVTTSRVFWWLAVLSAAGLTLVGVERLARRLLPLVVLLELSLVFPDRAPSRLRIALRSGDSRRLQGWARHSGDKGNSTAIEQAEAVLTLVAALNAHDRGTRGHSERVRALTDLVARELRLSEAGSDRLRWAALLHDIGKLMTPTALLNKRSALDVGEWAVVRRHPADGARLTGPLASWLGEWASGISQHHERFDGNGYPDGLAGDEIGLAGRILSITDAFETMTAARAYKQPMSVARARGELVACAGSHFDPRIVRAFLSISLPRLHWTVGLGAALAQVPLVGSLPRAATLAGRSAIGPSAAGSVAAATALALGVLTIPAGPNGPLGPADLRRDDAAPTVASAHGQATRERPPSAPATDGRRPDRGVAAPAPPPGPLVRLGEVLGSLDLPPPLVTLPSPPLPPVETTAPAQLELPPVPLPPPLVPLPTPPLPPVEATAPAPLEFPPVPLPPPPEVEIPDLDIGLDT